MGMVIQNMMSTQLAADKQKSSLNKLKKASERLSSGYRINRASDDAAGLAVSEKLRSIRRGLKQGLRNIDDGIGFIHTVEGASQEIDNMLHRLKELAVQAANGTYDDAVDREAIDLEYQQILDEIDQMTDNADFNGVPLFEKHLSAYEMNEGDVRHNTDIRINSKNDTLVLGYTIDGVQKEVTVNIPHGTYSAEETADIIDTYLFENAPELIIGVNTDRQLTMQAEGGTVDNISGNAASLFYNTVIGSSDGYLLGVSVFSSDKAAMPVYVGENDTIAFRVGNTDDTLYSITLDPKTGGYTRSQLIDHINEKITQAGIPGDVKAVACENENGEDVIGLSSSSTITGLSGNFIKIDGKTSPIYDICKYGDINNSQAVLKGTRRIPSDLKIERGRNDYFVLNLKYYGDDASQQTASIRIDLLAADENTKIYATPSDLVNEIQNQIDAAGHPFTVSLNTSGGISITSDQYGGKCSVKLNKNDVPSEFMVYDLFDAGDLVKVQPGRGVSEYRRASFTSYKELGSPIYIPASENTLSFNITTSANNSSAETVQRIDVVIPSTTYASTDLLVQAMNDYLDNNYPDIADKLQFSIDASKTLKLYAEGPQSYIIEKINVISSSSAYNRLIGGALYDDNVKYTAGSEKPYSTSSSTVGGTSRPNVTTSSGSTTTGTTETKDTSNPFPQESDKYIHTVTSSASIKNGVTHTQAPPEGVFGDIEVGYDPATATLNNVLTLFTTTGTSRDDYSLTFDLEEKDGVTSYSIDIPKGSTKDQALAIIKDKVKGKINVSTSGSSIVLTTISEGKEVKFNSMSGDLIQRSYKSSLANRSGAVIDETANMVYVPSTLTVDNALSRLPYTATASNDGLVFTAGMHNYDLHLTHKTYTTLAELAAEINAQIAAADGGTAATTVKVGPDGKSLIFTGPAKEPGNVVIDDSSTSRLAYAVSKVDPSTPYYDPVSDSVKKPATMRAEGIDTHFPKTVNNTNNTITMDYTHPDAVDPLNSVTESLTITIPDGTYNNATEFTNAINAAIAADPSLNGKITASYASSGSSKGLTFTTVNGGRGYRLTNLGGTFGAEKYISTANTSGGTVDTGANVVRFPASAYNDKYNTIFTGAGVEVNDNNDHVSLTINGNLYEFDITHGVYQGTAGRNSLTAQLRAALAGADVTITDSGSTLDITTNGGGSGMKVTVNGTDTSPYFMAATSVKSPVSTARHESQCYIIGSNNCSSIEIKDYFNQMSFDFTQDGTTHTVNVTVPTGNYTAQTLRQAIQDSINQVLPPNSLEVYVGGSNNIGIRSASIYPVRSISNFQGGLFEKVFQSANYRNTVPHTETAGSSSASSTSYIVGRNDLAPQTADEIALGKNVIIYPALNDQLIFDLTYGGNRYKIELKIPAGEYTSRELAAAVQQAGRDKLNSMTDANGEPFPQDAFRATIGLNAMGLPESTTAIKSNDKLVMSFAVPDDGKVDDMLCIIDGIRGSAAYRIFYAATQSPTPSKVIGKADLTNGVMITAGENDTFSYTLDGTEYSVTIPEGTYTCDELYEYLNEQYEAMGSMVRCTNMDGHLMFYTIENGAYDIDVFKGNAADTLFYSGAKRESDSEIGIHTGRRTDTYIWYLRTRVDDHLMRINTTGVTTAARAAKAMDRIDAAVNYLSRWRALSGANENRSLHTYSRNQEYITNIEEADSTLRDADIAQEVSELAKQQILIQAQNAMIEQSKQQHSSIMDVMA